MTDTRDFLPEDSPLYELLRAYGLEKESERIKEAMPYGAEETELIDILNIMVRMGYKGAPIDTRICDIDPRLLPCAFVENKTGKLSTITESSPKKTAGTAYIFTKQNIKDPKEQKETMAAGGHGWFVTTLKRFQTLFLQIAIVSLVLNIVTLAMPLFLMVIYNRVVDTGSQYTVLYLGIGAMIAVITEIILRRTRSVGLAWFAARIDNIVSNRVLSRLLQLPAAAIEKASVASQVARLKAFDSVRSFFTGSLFLTLLDLPFTFIAWLVLAIIDIKLALVPPILLIIYAVIAFSFRQRLRLAMFNAARTRSTLQTHHIELFEKIQSLRLNGMNEIRNEQFRDISAAAGLASFHSSYMTQILETLVYTISTLAGLCVIYLGVKQTWAGEISSGALFASLMLFWKIIAPWQTLTSGIPRLEQIYRSIQQIDRLMTIDTERESAHALGKIKQLRGNLEFSKVGLRYSKDSDPVLVGFNLTAATGELIAVAGANGSGKSTILKLALGLYRPQAGAVYLDGRDIRQLDPSELRKHIAYVPQIPELFEGSIADNIRLGNPLASDREIWEALELADAKIQIEKLPHGLDTHFLRGSDASRSNLVYRIILARAYIKNSPLILIDEMPYAVLNSRTGTVFIERIKEWHGNKTIITVTHRDDYIAMADRAVGLLESGKTIIDSPQNVIRKLRDDSFREKRLVA